LAFATERCALAAGKSEDLERLPRESLLLLEDISAHHPRSIKGTTAAAIFIGSMVLGATGVLSLPIAFLLGVLALVLTNCLTARRPTRPSMRLLMMIGSMMAFGAAIEKSGTSAWLAGLVVAYVSPLGSFAVMAAFFALTMLLSQPMSNQRRR